MSKDTNKVKTYWIMQEIPEGKKLQKQRNKQNKNSEIYFTKLKGK